MKAILLAHALAAALLLSSAPGCMFCGRKKPPATARMTPPRGAVAHCVFFWLKEPGDAEARRRIIESTESFRAIPGVVDVHVGTMLPASRPVVDSTYDVGLVVVFTDDAALRAYEPHPIHQKAVKEIMGPMVAKVQVYDFAID